MTVQRYDSFDVSIKADLDNNGYLIDEPVIARVGFQEYKKPGGGVRVEFRPKEEVFRADSLAAFAGIPITLGHRWVTPSSAKGIVVGAVGSEGKQDGNNVRAKVAIHDVNAITRAIRKEFAELSVGYKTKDIERPGWGNDDGEYVWQDEHPECPEGWKHFDALQTNIKPNHLALVRKGRAGVARLNLDGDEEYAYNCDYDDTYEGVILNTIKLDGVEYSVDPAVLKYIATVEAQRESAKQDGERLAEQLKEANDSLAEKIADAVAKAKQDAAELFEVREKASELGVKCDSEDPRELKLAIVGAVYPDLKLDGKGDAYIDAYYDVAINADKMTSQRQEIKKLDSADRKKETKKLKPLNPRARLEK